MSESKQTFYVKMRGRVLGPFEPLRLKQMVKQGQLSRTHMLSEDQQQWLRAGDYKELFLSEAAQEMESAASAKGADNANSQQQTDQPAAVWHYSLGDSSNGPVTLTELKTLASRGKITANDLVWREGSEDWVAASAVPELASSFQVHVNQQRSFEVSASDVSGGVSAADVLELRAVVRGINPWVLFFAIVLYVISAILFVAFVMGLVVSARDQNQALIIIAISSLVQMGVMFTAAIFLNRYTSCCGKFVNTKDLQDLNDGLRWLGRFWVIVSIVTIIWLVLLFTMTILMAATIAAFFGF